MTSLLVRAIISLAVILTASELGRRFPRVGGFVLSLPLVSILALVMSWSRDHDLVAVSRLARETLLFVTVGLPLFLPLAFAPQFGLGFWQALALGIVLAAVTTAIGLFVAA